MKLDKLRLQNYRCFEHFEIDLHPKMTVLIAPNGGGKTSILDAARVALWPFVKGFDLGSQTGKSATIQVEDVRLSSQATGNMEPQLPSIIEAWGDWSADAPSKCWAQQRLSLKKSTNTTGDSVAKQMTAHGKAQEKLVRSEEPIVLPLVSYLGTSRLWFEGRFTSVAAEATLDKNQYSRTSGYLNCLAYSSSFKAFSLWYGWLYRSYRELQLIALETKTGLSQEGCRLEQTIQAIKTAINTLIEAPTGWKDLEYRSSQQQQLVMQHPLHGTLPLELLSDGLRNAIAMVADLAFRTCKLNPQFGSDAPLKTPGVVLIDEVDMFLHPQWQQTIIGSLQTAFPELQFIVTTHSPQVLSTVRRESIRIISQDADGQMVASRPLGMTYGEPSGDVLHTVMQVDPQPPIAEKADLQHLTEWIDQGLYDQPKTKALMQRLVTVLGEQHPQLQRLQRSIRRQEALNG